MKNNLFTCFLLALLTSTAFANEEDKAEAHSPLSLDDRKVFLRVMDAKRMAIQVYEHLSTTYPASIPFQRNLRSQKAQFIAMVEFARKHFPDMLIPDIDAPLEYPENEITKDKMILDGSRSLDTALSIAVDIEYITISEIDEAVDAAGKANDMAKLFYQLRMNAGLHLAALKGAPNLGRQGPSPYREQRRNNLNIRRLPIIPYPVFIP